MEGQTLELQLFTEENIIDSVPTKQIITEDQIVTPLVEVLNQATPNPILKNESKEISQSLKQSLDDLFPEQQYDEKDVQKAKELLGARADVFTSEQLKDEITKIQYLCETWLDDFEREIFKGVTLKELLHEKGSP